jgi:hypothetical protein
MRIEDASVQTRMTIVRFSNAERNLDTHISVGPVYIGSGGVEIYRRFNPRLLDLLVCTACVIRSWILSGKSRRFGGRYMWHDVL